MCWHICHIGGIMNVWQICIGLHATKARPYSSTEPWMPSMSGDHMVYPIAIISPCLEMHAWRDSPAEHGTRAWILAPEHKEFDHPRALSSPWIEMYGFIPAKLDYWEGGATSPRPSRWFRSRISFWPDTQSVKVWIWQLSCSRKRLIGKFLQ